MQRQQQAAMNPYRARCWAARLAVLALAATCLALPAPALAAQSVTMQDVDFGEIDSTCFMNGAALRTRQPLWWESDAAWRVTVESLDATLGASDDGSYQKRLGDLQFKLSTSREWLVMLRDPQVLATGHGPGSGTLFVDWRVRLDWERDRPGQYGADLLITIDVL